jgi:hypothetical protein
MSQRKVISINPDLFNWSNLTKKNKSTNRERGERPIKIKNNQLKVRTTKNKILKHIREKQEENYKKMFESTISNHNANNITNQRTNKLDFTPEMEPSSDLELSVSYLQSIAKDQEEKKRKEYEDIEKRNNITMKYQPISDSSFFKSIISDHVDTQDKRDSEKSIGYNNVYDTIQPNNTYQQLHMPVVLSKPKYGCLKNGNLPTYKQFMKTNNTTYKVNSNNISNNIPNTNNIQPNFSPEKIPGYSAPSMNNNYIYNDALSPPSPQIPKINTIKPIGDTPEDIKQNERLKNISEMKQLRQLLDKKNKAKEPRKTLKQKKTIKRTHYLGKSKVLPKVSVLVSNKTIRNQVNKKALDLKQVPISDVKKYLMQKGFIRVGSSAPNDVVRRMYETAHMIGGDINNHNPDNLLYNYLNA